MFFWIKVTNYRLAGENNRLRQLNLEKGYPSAQHWTLSASSDVGKRIGLQMHIFVSPHNVLYKIQGSIPQEIRVPQTATFSVFTFSEVPFMLLSLRAEFFWTIRRLTSISGNRSLIFCRLLRSVNLLSGIVADFKLRRDVINLVWR